MAERLGGILKAARRLARRVRAWLSPGRRRSRGASRTRPISPEYAAPAQAATRLAQPDERPRSREELLAYWRLPSDGNVPARYRDTAARSRYLVELVERHMHRHGRILEIGCNIGRNLEFLRQAGYRDLTGIEISTAAVEALRESFPDLGHAASLHVGPVEEVIRTLSDRSFDLVFTMAVLEHIHPDSEWVFAEMARICRGMLVTIEDERTTSWRHFPRPYGDIFGGLGLRQIEEADCSGPAELPKGFRARVFAARRIGDATAVRTARS